MPSVLLWNVNKSNAKQELNDLAMEYNPEIICIIEPPRNEVEILDMCPSGYSLIHSIGCEKVKFLTILNLSNICIVYDHDRLLCALYQDGITEFLIAGVHLPDKGNYKSNEIKKSAERIHQYISSVENECGTKRTLVVGDFNMDPFEEGMVSLDGFHAIPDASIVNKRRSRKALGIKSDLFYNPCWHINRLNSSMGTYYYDDSGHLLNYFWHIFDQVILRPELIEKFDHNSLKIVTKIKGIDIVLKRSAFPDHLPLYFNVRV